MNGVKAHKRELAWPRQGCVGLVLLFVCWPLNWTMPGMRTAYLFFPLWLGYILVIDPKWIYHTPGAQFLHVFEMPLLGYGGYIPFGLELYALKNFLWSGSPRLQL